MGRQPDESVWFLKPAPELPAVQPAMELDTAYYRLNLATGQEEFSQRLRQLFRMDDFALSWEAFCATGGNGMRQLRNCSAPFNWILAIQRRIVN